MTSNFRRTADWLKAAGKQPGNEQHISVQAGVMLEEMAELLACLRTPNDGYQMLLDRTRTDLEWFASKLKRQEQMVYIPTHKRVDALDAFCDVEVTLNGVAWLSQMDKDGADQEVLASNESKLNEDGTAVILEGGKVGKSSRYIAPNLKSFV